MIYRLIANSRNYLTVTFDIEEVIEKFGEDDLMPFDQTPREFRHGWKVVNVDFVDDGEGAKVKQRPDLDFNSGHVYLAGNAAKALAPLLEKFGELLEVVNQGERAYIFNPLKIVSADQALSAKNPVSGDVTHLSFSEDSEEHFIFRTDYDGYHGVFVNDKFKKIVEEQGLTGMHFETDLSNIFERTNDTNLPTSH